MIYISINYLEDPEGPTTNSSSVTSVFNLKIRREEQ